MKNLILGIVLTLTSLTSFGQSKNMGTPPELPVGGNKGFINNL